MHVRFGAKSILSGVACASLILAGCSSGGSSGESAGSATPAATGTTAAATPAPPPQAHGTIRLLYVEWDSCVAATDMVKGALEQAGYKVQTTSVGAGAMFEGIAHDDADAMVCAWLPTTHAAYYARTRDQLDKVAANMQGGATIGLVVPDYVTVDSIADLTRPDVAKKFGNRIIGIDPGAGEMEQTHKVIKAYGLPEKLIDGSDATMTAELASKIQQHQWVVVTGWNPHWMWSRWKLKYLKDPKGTYGAPQSIYTLVRKGLRQQDPRAYQILANYRRTIGDTDAIMDAGNKPGGSIEKAAQAWLKDHPEQVQKWLSTK